MAARLARQGYSCDFNLGNICGILCRHRDLWQHADKRWASSARLFRDPCFSMVSTTGLKFRFHASL